MIKVDKGGGGVKNVWILVDVNKERSLNSQAWEHYTDATQVGYTTQGVKSCTWRG